MRFFQKKQLVKSTNIISPLNGVIINTASVSDKVFANEIMGQTVAIQPTDATCQLLSPVEGICEVVFPTFHAYGIRMDNGLSILVHVGINTVELEGQGFSALVKQGDRVKLGQALVNVDFDYIASKQYDPTTMIVVLENPKKEPLVFLDPQVIQQSNTLLQ